MANVLSTSSKVRVQVTIALCLSEGLGLGDTHVDCVYSIAGHFRVTKFSTSVLATLFVNLNFTIKGSAVVNAIRRTSLWGLIFFVSA